MSSSVPAMAAVPPDRMVPQQSAIPSRGNRNCQQDESYELQYQRDLETLDRIERQREEEDPCFFCAMGDIAARRARG